jgi:predicted nuclease of predicted toxin-antitoxin system
MPEMGLAILLDQNIPATTASWLRLQRPAWQIWHVNELGLQGQPDETIYKWAQENQAVIMTYDEDFADARFYPLGHHYGVVRLRVWPTTTEMTIAAIARLLADIPAHEWKNNLIIVDNTKIRLRRL